MYLLSFATISSSIVDVARDSLALKSESTFRWVLIWGGIVALGCLLEIGETWTSVSQWLKFRIRGEIPNDDPGSWHKPIAAIGLLLVIVGIVGETVCEAIVSRDETAIRAHDEEILGDAQGKAASATQKAAELGKDTQSLRTEAETQKGIAAKERLARVRLEAKVNPRRLTPEQIEDIGNALKPYAGKTVSVATYRQDAEAMILALQIEEALGKAKILVYNMVGSYSAVGCHSLGMVVDNRSVDKTLESALIDALIHRATIGASEGPVQFGGGSEMYTPPLPSGFKTLNVDAAIFVGEKPIDIPPQTTH